MFKTICALLRKKAEPIIETRIAKVPVFPIPKKKPAVKKTVKKPVIAKKTVKKPVLKKK